MFSELSGCPWTNSVQLVEGEGGRGGLVIDFTELNVVQPQ